MSGRKIRWIFAILALAMVLTFQNCEGLQSGQGSQEISSANGDGYSGITVDYPETVESGSHFVIRIAFFFVNGLDFELIEGQASIQPIPNTHRAIIAVEDDYVGSLVIKVTNKLGISTLVEIQVVAPQDITDGDHNQSFGNTMILSGKRIVAGIPMANDKENGYQNQGRVVVYNQNPTSFEINFHQSIPNPEPDPVVEARFGQSIDGFMNQDLLIGAPNSNKVFHYRSVDVEDRIRDRFELVDVLENPEGIRFGASVIVNEWRMVIAERGDSNTPGNGKLYVYTRASADVTNFTYSHQINSPIDVVNFGRSLDKVGNLLIVSGYKPNEGSTTRHGVVLIYDTMSGNLVQTIEKMDAPGDYGTVLNAKLGYLFLGASRDNKANPEVEKEFVDVFKLNVLTNRYEEVQRLVNPLGESAMTQFSQAIAFNGSQLFISAPDADSPQQKESGIIYTYRLNEGSGLFDRTGVITPNFEKFDYVSKLGRSMACDQTDLFVSVRGITKESNLQQADIYSVPLK